MLNWWLILLLVLTFLLCIGLGIYVLFYFLSEEDEKGGYFAKLIVIVGITITTGCVLLLPFDVANKINPTIDNSFKHLDPIPIEWIWQIILWIILFMAIVIVPFTMFFYEAYDPDKSNIIIRQCGQAFIYTIGIIGIFSILCSICYIYIGKIEIPVYIYTGNPQILLNPYEIQYNESYKIIYKEIKVHIFIYCIGLICLLGWVAFFFYGGVGLISFPIDLLIGFINRPKAIKGKYFIQEMDKIAKKGDILLEMALNLQKLCRNKISFSQRRKINILYKETYILEAQQNQLIWAYTQIGGSFLIIYGRLILCLLSLCLSLCWILHIFIYNTFNIHFFLNYLLILLDQIFSLFGIILYFIFIFYLIWITFEGQIRVGMRFIFFQIHPIKPHDTTLNSLLFNISLFLFTSISVLQFTARSFQEYIAWTAIDSLMNIYIIHLKYIGIIIYWAQFCFIGMSVLSLPWIILCPMHRKQKDPTLIRIDT